MYSQFPAKDEKKHVYSLAGAWAFIALAGLGGILLTPNTVITEQGEIFPRIASSLVLASGLVGFIAVLYRKWVYESVVSYFAISGLIGYVSTVWFLVFTGEPTRLQQASLITALVFFVGFRIVSYAAHARRLRRLHELEEKIERL